MRFWKWQKQYFTKININKHIPSEKIGRVRFMLIIEDDKEQRNVPKNKQSVYYLKQKRVRKRRKNRGNLCEE